MSRLPTRMPSAAQQAANANIWPGMTAATAAQFTRIGRGLPISKPNQFAQVHVRYYHQQTYAAAGQTQLTFFQVGATEHVTNLNNGIAPDERPFWLTGLTCQFQFLTSGGAASTAQPFSADTVASVAFQQISNAMAAGLLQLYVGDRLIHEGQGLDKYCADGGAWSSPSSALASNNVVPYNNGMPLAGNRFKFPSPYPILPGKPVKLTCRWQTAYAITGLTAARLRVELVGESVMPLNA